MPLPAAVLGAFGLTSIIKAAIAWFVVNVACKLVFRILFALGIGLITYAGLNPLTSFFSSYISNSLGGLDIQLQALIHETNVDKYISILFSYFTYVLTLRLSKSYIGPRQTSFNFKS